MDREREIHKIRDLILKSYNITIEDFFRHTRKEPIAMARQVFFYCLREKYKLSFPVIAKIFNKDHTTVVHAHKKIDRLAKEDRKLGDFILLLLNIKEDADLSLLGDTSIKQQYVSREDVLLKNGVRTYSFPIRFNSGYMDKIFLNLEDRERYILKNRYGFESSTLKTLEELGKDQNVPRERIRQIIYSSIKKLFLRNYQDIGQIVYFTNEELDKNIIVSVDSLLRKIFILDPKDKKIAAKFLLAILSIIKSIHEFNFSDRIFLIKIRDKEIVLMHIDNIKLVIKRIESNIPITIKSKREYILDELKKDRYFFDKPQLLDDYFIGACYSNYLFESQIIIHKRENFKKYNLPRLGEDESVVTEKIKGVPKEYDIFFQ